MSRASFHTAVRLVYSSKQMYNLAYFIARLYDPNLPSIVKQVRSISINVPHDNTACSGLTHYLYVFAKDPSPHRCQPGDLGIAADMCRSLIEANHKDSHQVSYRNWFWVIVRLLRCCTNVKTTEVPAEWGDVQWYDNDFPTTDLSDFLQQKSQLNDVGWGWGKDPIVLPTDWTPLMDGMREFEKAVQEEEKKDERSMHSE